MVEKVFGASGRQQRQKPGLLEVLVGRQGAGDSARAHDFKAGAIGHAPFLVRPGLEQRQGLLQQFAVHTDDFHARIGLQFADDGGG